MWCTDRNAEDQTVISKGYVNTYMETNKGRLWFSIYKGEGRLIVEKGFDFVYSSRQCGCTARKGV